MKVTLREKLIKGGRISLYLDFYPAIVHSETGKDTRREFLGLHLIEKPRTELERQHNKETRLLAQNICAKRQLEVQAGNYGFLKKKVLSVDFLAFFKEQAEIEKAKGLGSRNNWLSVYQHLEHFAGGALAADDITPDFCKAFRDYLITAKPLNVSKSVKSIIAFNSAVGYFTIFKTGVKRALDAGVLTNDPVQNVKRLTRKETQREFLTLAELQRLAKTDCDLPYLKRAALFSSVTGLRYSDVAKLTWAEVYDDTNGSYMRFTQKKTAATETMPLNETARTLLGERGTATNVVFPDLLYSSWQNQKLQSWAYQSGIKRPITFHAFRHTFATLQLQQGTDISTISKLLGHRSITTTLIYTKIIDQQKRNAVNRLNIEL
jgi:integrase